MLISTFCAGRSFPVKGWFTEIDKHTDDFFEALSALNICDSSFETHPGLFIKWTKAPLIFAV